MMIFGFFSILISLFNNTGELRWTKQNRKIPGIFSFFWLNFHKLFSWLCLATWNEKMSIFFTWLSIWSGSIDGHIFHQDKLKTSLWKDCVCVFKKNFAICCGGTQMIQVKLNYSIYRSIDLIDIDRFHTHTRLARFASGFFWFHFGFFSCLTRERYACCCLNFCVFCRSIDRSISNNFFSSISF